MDINLILGYGICILIVFAAIYICVDMYLHLTKEEKRGK